jgi:integrase
LGVTSHHSITGGQLAIRTRKWQTASGEDREAYVVDYRDRDGKRHIETFDRKKDADAREAAIKVDIRAGTHVAPSRSITVAEAAAEWLATCENKRGLERTTTVNYESHVRLHIVPLIGRLKLTDLTATTVTEFEDKLLAEGRTVAMARKVLTSLGNILAEAQRRGKVQRNAVRDLGRSHKTKRSRKQLKVGADIPSPIEMKAIIAAATSQRWRTLLLVTALTGMRASEVRGLRWQDVDLKSGEIHIRQKIDHFGKVGEPKTATSSRTIPLPGPAVQTLREWKIKSGSPDDGLVFQSRNGKYLTLAGIVLRGLKAAGVAAGVVKEDGSAKYSGLHSLRHFYASWCINRTEDGGCGLPAKLVQERLGHSSITIALDVYGHLFPRGDDGGALNRAAEALLG